MCRPERRAGGERKGYRFFLRKSRGDLRRTPAKSRSAADFVFEFRPIQLFEERADAGPQLFFELPIVIQDGSGESDNEENPADGFLGSERQIGSHGPRVDGDLGEQQIVLVSRFVEGLTLAETAALMLEVGSY